MKAKILEKYNASFIDNWNDFVLSFHFYKLFAASVWYISYFGYCVSFGPAVYCKTELSRINDCSQHLSSSICFNLKTMELDILITHTRAHARARTHTHTHTHTDYADDQAFHPNTLDQAGHLWWCNGWQTRLASQHEWVRVSLGAPFIRPCVTSKQRAS